MNVAPASEIPPDPCHSFRAVTTMAVSSRITTVRRNVARSELTSATPSLPKMAVRAAKNADPTASTFQFAIMLKHTSCESAGNVARDTPIA